MVDRDVRDVFEKLGFKIYYDESGKGLKEDKFKFYELRGPRGLVYPYNDRQLAAQAYRGDDMNPTHFVKTRGYKVIQDAEDMLVFLFPKHDFPQIAEKFELKRKRVLTADNLEKLAKARSQRQFKAKDRC